MKKKVAIIGGGTAALFLAAFIDTDSFDVVIYEKMNTLGRKFLVAGDGGFNLSHGEDLAILKSRYTPAGFLDSAIESFSNTDLRAWLLNLGIPTFVGTSGRIFPEKGIKPIQVLSTIKKHIESRGVELKYNQVFTGWDTETRLMFNTEEVVDSDYTVFALGGTSWKVTGSDGSWLNTFQEKGIDIHSFKSSNCAYKIDWPTAIIEKHEGSPLKNIAISAQGKVQKGEAVITKFGLEGNAIYGLSPQIRVDLEANNKAIVFVDFKPTLSLSSIVEKLEHSKSNITTSLKEKLKLPAAAIALVKQSLTKEEYLDNSVLANRIKKYPITILEAGPMDEAISTSGGIPLNAVDDNFELKTLKNHFCIGEMLDWDAPTGGYLIQGCVSSAVYVAKYLNEMRK